MIHIGDGIRGKRRFRYTFKKKEGNGGANPVLPGVVVEASTLDDAIRQACKKLTMSWSGFNAKYEIVSTEELPKAN